MGGVEQDAEAGVGVVDGREIGLAVVVEISHNYLPWSSTDLELPGRLEAAVAIAQQNGEGVQPPGRRRFRFVRLVLSLECGPREFGVLGFRGVFFRGKSHVFPRYQHVDRWHYE